MHNFYRGFKTRQCLKSDETSQIRPTHTVIDKERHCVIRRKRLLLVAVMKNQALVYLVYEKAKE